MTNLTQDLYRAYALGYRVTEGGELISPTGKVRAGCLSESGYFRFTIGRSGGKTGHVMVHRLQAYQKFGEAALVEGVHVRHLDGNSRNNSAANISIGTASENMMDKSPSARLSAAIKASRAAQVHDHSAVLSFYQSCKSYRKTMAEFGITSKWTLNFILRKSIEAVKALNNPAIVWEAVT